MRAAQKKRPKIIRSSLPQFKETPGHPKQFCYNRKVCGQRKTSQKILRFRSGARRRLSVLHAGRCRTPAPSRIRAQPLRRPRGSLRHRYRGAVSSAAPFAPEGPGRRDGTLCRRRARREGRAIRQRVQHHARWGVGVSSMNDLKKLIREVPDYPKPGILFYDLTTLLKDKQGFHSLIDRLCSHYAGHTIDLVAGMEARGFIFAPALAYRLGAGFVPVRKPKKLPAKTAKVSYALEYGTDTLEMHEDAVQKGQRVLICDDLLATGGTASATAKLVERLGGTVEDAAFAVELSFLKGRSKLPGLDVFSLMQFDK